MKSPSKTNQELLEENVLLKQRIQYLERLGSNSCMEETAQANEALRESERKYRFLAEKMTDMVWIVDTSLRTVYVSPSIETMLGFTPEERVLQKVEEQLTPASMAFVSELLLKELALEQQGNVDPNRTITVDLEYYHRDGSTRWIENILNGIRDEKGVLTGLHGVSRDITRRKRAEDALKENEALLGRCLENAPDGVYMNDLQGNFLYGNHKSEEIIGYQREELIGKSFLDANILSEKSIEKAAEFLQVNIEGKSTGPDELELISKGGHLIPIEINTSVIQRNDQKIVLGFVRDITERKKTEDALRESEARYRLLAENATDVIWTVDMDMRLTYISPSVTRLLGFTAEEAMARTMQQVFTPESFEKAGQIIVEEMALESSGHADAVRSRILELDLVRKDGSTVPVEGNFCFLRNPEGKVTGILAIVRDITERKRAEDALQERNIQFKKLSSWVPGMIYQFTKRPDGTYCMPFTTEAIKDIFGCSPQDVREDFSPIARVVLPEDLGKLTDSIEYSAKHMTVWTCEYRAQIPGQSVKWLLGNSTPEKLPDGSITWYGFNTDITKRKRAEEEVRKNRKQLADIIEFLPDATLVIDKEGKVIAWNRTMEAMTGVKKEDMLGKENYEYALPFYGDRRPILIDFALQPDREAENRQYGMIQRVDERLFIEGFMPNSLFDDRYFYAAASVLRDEKNEIIGAIECIRDNTERKTLEDRLIRAEKMEVLGTLAGGVAHDLNNVLGAMVGYSELLLGKLPGDSFLRNYADKILQSSLKSSRIIQDLLTLARRGVVVSEIMDLNQVVSEYLRTPEFEKLKFYHPNVKIWTELAGEHLNIVGSSIHLGKALMNLVSNAAEAISGQGEVVIRTKNRYMDHPIRGYDDMQEGSYAVLMISDTGSGIPSKDLSKIFEPFYTKKVMGRSGTGLGLTIVWGAVKDHNGYIDVRSDENRGTTFSLYFPITLRKAMKAKKPASPVVYTGRGESILVVDDIEAQRELAKSIFEMLGYHVEAVPSGEKALEYFKDGKADLIVMDMIMEPGMDGMETYRRIREINPKQKAIIVSGFVETDRVMEAQAMGAGTLVQKPYTVEKIGLAVRQELDRE